MNKLSRFFSNSFLFGVSLIILGSLFAAQPVHAVVSWNTTTVDANIIASSTRVLWDTTSQNFAVGYVTSDGTTLKFSTSTAGASWVSPVTALSTTNLTTSDAFFTTNGGGTGYVMMGMISGAPKKYLNSSNGGSTWSSSDLQSVDYYVNGHIQADSLGNTYIAGRVLIGATDQYVVSTKTSFSPSADLFTSSTAVGPLSENPTVDFAYTPTNGVIVYSIGTGDMGVVTSTNMTSWTNFGFTPSASYGVLLRPRVKFDSNGMIYILYVGANDSNCSVACDVLLSRRVGSSWVTEVVDTVGSISFNAQHDLAFVNGTTPIITYYNNTDGVLRYAYKDSGNSGCSGTAAASWTCGNVDTGFTLAPSVAITTNSSTGAVIVYQNNLTSLKAAYATISAAAATLNTSFPKQVVPGNPIIIVNHGDLTAKNVDIDVQVSATNATEVALSTNPDFYNVSWQPISPVMKVRLQKQSGTQYVYAKFTNTTGGVSNTVFGTVVYTSLQPVTSIESTPIVVIQQPISSDISTPKSEPKSVVTYYDSFIAFENFDPFNAGTQSGGAVILFERPSCPERINAFTLGGTVIKDASGKMFVILSNQNVACPVLSTTVAQSWGIYSYKRGSVVGRSISTALPYRPGTIVRDSKTRASFFVNTKGKLHPFTDQKKLTQLGYGKNQVFLEKTNVLNSFTKSAALTRTDIHPDGTLLIMNAAKGEYGILQERVLHPVSRSTLLKFKEKLNRAVRFMPGEYYQLGVRWQ